MQAQQTICIRDINGEITGHCDLWWRNTPHDPNHRIGLIGRFHADDGDSAQRLLANAGNRLKAEGCTMALGPMDGDSWHSYRATTRAGTRPAFVMEPSVDDTLAGYFTAAGFNLHSSYISAEMDLDGARISNRYRLLSWFLGKRLRLRNLDIEDYDAEMERIHRFCCRAFNDNHLYTPIDAREFCALYEPLRTHINPELVFIVEKDGQILGLLFAIPDLNQLQRGEAIDTLIFKTLAVAPEMRGRGIAFLLMYRGLRAARAAGYRRIIHALMYRDNRSRGFSDNNQVDVIREYGLFSREL
ncbi:MAG: N-acetyltransferase [Gammaproteobacteria bacterium]|nr:MAG: N-acetyltransferase [Gammaproteobacteria bacterium]